MIDARKSLNGDQKGTVSYLCQFIGFPLDAGQNSPCWMTAEELSARDVPLIQAFWALHQWEEDQKNEVPLVVAMSMAQHLIGRLKENNDYSRPEIVVLTDGLEEMADSEESSDQSAEVNLEAPRSPSLPPLVDSPPSTPPPVVLIAPPNSPTDEDACMLYPDSDTDCYLADDESGFKSAWHLLDCNGVGCNGCATHFEECDIADGTNMVMLLAPDLDLVAAECAGCLSGALGQMEHYGGCLPDEEHEW